jgi:hypothetical protein
MIAPPVRSQPLMFGVLRWFAVGISLGAVCLLAQIPGWVAWPLGSLAATTLYITGAAAELGLLTRAQPCRPPGAIGRAGHIPDYGSLTHGLQSEPSSEMRWS